MRSLLPSSSYAPPSQHQHHLRRPHHPSRRHPRHPLTTLRPVCCRAKLLPLGRHTHPGIQGHGPHIAAVVTPLRFCTLLCDLCHLRSIGSQHPACLAGARHHRCMRAAAHSIGRGGSWSCGWRGRRSGCRSWTWHRGRWHQGSCPKPGLGEFGTEGKGGLPKCMHDLHAKRQTITKDRIDPQNNNSTTHVASHLPSPARPCVAICFIIFFTPSLSPSTSRSYNCLGMHARGTELGTAP